MTDKIGKKKIGRIIAVTLLAMVMVVGLIPNNALAAETKIADASTVTKYTESLGDDASTEYAGRIWTDKSVYAGNADILLKTGEIQQFENDSDFLVAYSALATSQTVSGATKAPVDVVFIIDTSGSMTYNMSNTDSTKRIANTVEALNDAIQAVMELNEYTRVSVVAFANTSEVLLPLGRYEKGTRTSSGNRVTDYFSLGNNNGTLYVHAKYEGTNTTVTDNRSVTGGTNIQRGIYEGMNVLATETSTTADVNGSTIQRVPSVVLLSDGAPTYSVGNTGNNNNQTRWWNPANNNNQGDGSNPYYGNGMKALMTGAYMKEAINRNYGVTGTAMETTMYTVGMGITGLSNYEQQGYGPGGGGSVYTGEQDLAYMTLNPKANWDNENDMAEAIVNAWGTYTNDRETRVMTDDNQYYTFDHPAQYDIDSDADALKNLVDDYYDADSAAAVTNVFQQIVANISISAPEVPTELKHTDALTTGYIYYTDPIGEYMELKEVKGIIYDGKYYNSVTKNEDGTYTVSAEVDSALYGKQNLSSINIAVTGTPGNQTLKIDVPAALIPLRINTVELNEDGSVKSHTNNGSFPIRVLYTVGLVDGITTGTGEDKVVNTKEISADYLAANTDAETGNINFYSNLYDGTSPIVNEHTTGNATVEFEPSHTNPFYYMQEDIAIYKKDADGNLVQVTAAEGLDDDTVYQYTHIYYHGTSEEVEVVERTGAQLKRTEIIEKDGYLYREAGSPRLNRILEFEGTKEVNNTGTAGDFYAPTFVNEDSTDPADGKYVIYLGNNGKLSLPATGALEISKTVEKAANLTPSTTEFEFTVNFNGDATLAGEFAYEIVGTEITGTITDGGTLTLEDGQTARITGLAPGTTYEVIEKDYTDKGFTTTVSGDTGSIAAGQTSEADFVNTYEVEEIVFPPTGDTGFTGKKVLDGRAWIDGTDAYTFLITPYNNAPLPAGYDAEQGVTVTSAASVDADTYEAAFDFGKITFTEPGVYRYTIVEREPATDEFLPGLTYSRALYRVVVTVIDNGDGTLSAVSDIQKLYTDDATQLFTYDADNNIVMNEGQEAQDEIVFTNTYAAGAVTRVPVATKTYTDTSGEKPLVSGMFTFQLEAIGYCVGDYDEKTLVADKTIPMPEGTEDGKITTTNEGGNVTFPSVTFEHDDLKGQTKVTYRYKITEVAGNVQGMTYDKTVYYANVVVSTDGSSDVLSVVAVYLNEAGEDVRIATFANQYDPEDVIITEDAGNALHGTKTLTGRDMKDTDVFTFTVEAANDAAKNILPAAETKQAAVADGVAKFWFSDMTFTQPGVYVFNITEEAGNAGGVTYDSHTTVATVTVVDNNGKLEAAVTYDNGEVSDATGEAKFVNTYDADPVTDTTALTGKKTLTGKALVPGEFFFEVEDVKAGQTNLVGHAEDTDGDGTADITFLKDVTYTEAGTYVYLIREQIPTPTVTGNVYDESEYRYEVIVEDDGNGQLVIKSRTLQKWNDETKAWDSATEIVFNNEYAPVPVEVTIPPITKVISGDRADALKAGEFKFELTLVDANPADGVQLPAVTEVGNAEDGTVLFDKVTFYKAGTYTFKIKEVIPTNEDIVQNADGTYTNTKTGITYSTQEIITTMSVTDDRNGNLTLTVTENIGGKTITNEYDTIVTVGPNGVAKLQIEKDFTGRANDSWLDTDKFDFEVEVSDADTIAAIESGEIESASFEKSGEVYVIDGLSIAKKGDTVVIPDITFHKPGQTYKFNIREIDGKAAGITYDGNDRVVEIETADNGDGTMSVTINDGDGTVTDGIVTFKNVYDTTSTDISGHDELAIHKVFTGREEDKWLDTDKFTFTLGAADSATQTAIDNGVVELTSTELVVTNANRAYPHFGNIVFHEAGTYKFVVTELPSGIEGVKDDADPDRNITVKVEDNGQGELVANVTDKDSLTFSNTYSTTKVVLEGKEDLEVIKKLTGRDWFDSDAFTFTLSVEEGSTTADAIAAGNVIMPSDLSLTISKGDAEGTEAGTRVDAFGDITFKVPGVYTFFIEETPGDIDNVAYDGHRTEVVVTVEDNQKGELKVAATSYIGSMTFENVYTPDEISVPIGDDVDGKKVLNGRTLADGEFTFTMSKAEDSPANTPMPAVTEVKNQGDKISFGTITYTEPGTYIYFINEVKGELPGMNYDEGTVKATVEVTYDPKAGKLSADVSYEKAGGNGGEGFTFVNEYTSEPTDPVDLTVKKAVNPTEGNSFTMSDGDFEFEIEPSKSNPQPDPIAQHIADNTAAGDVAFANVQFIQAGTYVYTVHEVAGTKGGIIYDPSIYTITVVVTDDESIAKLGAEITVTKDGEKIENGLAGITFVNAYDPHEATAIIHGHKNLDGGHKALEAGEFKFKLEAADENTPMPASDEATNTETGLFQFGLITYDAVGTYKYTVSEVIEDKAGYVYDEKAYEVVVTVTDENGVLKADVEGIKNADDTPIIVLNNGYYPGVAYTDIEGTKKLTVPEGSPRELKAGEFTFELLDEQGKVVGTAANTAEGGFIFEDVAFDKAGTYNYTIVEKAVSTPGVTNDPQNSIPVKIDVTDEGGALKAVVTYPEGGAVFTNEYAPLETAIQLSSVKILEGRELVEGEFTFQLTDAEGNVIDEASNDAKGVVTFDKITYTAEGEYKYKIFEVQGDAERVTYDDTVYDVTVTVKDGGEGYLVAEVEQASDALVFVNIYNAPVVPADVTFEKTQSVNDGKATSKTKEVKAGDKVTYYLTVKNAADAGVASNVTIVDTIPAGLDLVETDGVGVEHEGTITWNISPLEPGAERTVWFTVEVPEVEEDTEWENIATVTYDDPDDPLVPEDPDEPDKEVPSNPVVIEEGTPDVAFTKEQAINDGKPSDKDKTVAAGDLITYYLTVTNNGTEAAENIVITDKIPEGLKLVDAGEGVEEDGTITWEINSLGAGESKTVYFIVRVPEVNADTTYENTAQMTYDNKPGDPEDPGNPEDSNTVTVGQKAPEKEEPKDETPDTGDNTNMMLWLMLLAASGAGLAGAAIYKRRRG